MLSPENAATLALEILNAPQVERPEKLFRLLKGIGGIPPPHDAPLEWKRQHDRVFAVLQAIFPLTSRCEEAFALAIDDDPVEWAA